MRCSRKTFVSPLSESFANASVRDRDCQRCQVVEAPTCQRIDITVEHERQASHQVNLHNQSATTVTQFQKTCTDDDRTRPVLARAMRVQVQAGVSV